MDSDTITEPQALPHDNGALATTIIAEEMVELEAEEMAVAYRILKEHQEEVEQNLDELTAHIGKDDDNWEQAFAAGMPLGEFQIARRKAIQRQLETMTDVFALRTMGSQLTGLWVDSMLSGSNPEEDLMCSGAFLRATLGGPEVAAQIANRINGRQKAEKMNAFQGELITKYGSMISGGGFEMWCPIAQGGMNPMRQAVVPTLLLDATVVEEKTAAALFGGGREHVWSAENGLMICMQYHRLLETAKAVILPASGEPDEREFCVFLLTADIGNGSYNDDDISDGAGGLTKKPPPIWGRRLDGSRLAFVNDFRPRKEYLYFQCAMSLLRRHRAGLPTRLDDLPDYYRSLWTAPGPSLRQSILYKMARQLGCLSVKRADWFWTNNVRCQSLLSTGSDDDRASTLAIVTSTMICTRDFYEPLFVDIEDENDRESEDEEDESDLKDWEYVAEWPM